ncbi:MAG: signal peptidase II [Gammaproteobacteria bacterium]
MRHKIYYLSCLGLLVLDQLSKQFVASSFSLGESLSITSFFSWTYLQNSGAAFSLFADSGDHQRYLLLSISVIASLALIVWMHKTAPSFRQRLLGQSILLAGAVGNLIDRVLYGVVIDFIDLHYEGFYWPVFNLADSFILIGVFLLLFEGRQSNASSDS